MTKTNRKRLSNLRRKGSKRSKNTIINSIWLLLSLFVKKFVKGGRSQIQMHHIKRIFENGLTSMENGSLLCDKCHKYVHSFDGSLEYERLANIIRRNKIIMLKEKEIEETKE